MMKKILKSLSIIVLLMSIVVISSCKKDDNGVIILPSMKASVDGEEWSSIFRLSLLKDVGGIPTMVITGTPTISQTADKTIILTIRGTEVGTYTLGIGEATATAQCVVVYKKTADADTGGSNYFTSTQASITISKIDKEKKTISGTFSATLINLLIATPVVITNGTFENLNYQVN